MKFNNLPGEGSMAAVISLEKRARGNNGDPVVVALEKQFTVEDCISSSIVPLFVEISGDTNPIHQDIEDVQAFGIPCEFTPMHGMLLASRVGGLIWNIILKNSPEPVRAVLVDGLPRFKRFMRVGEPFTLKVHFAYIGKRANQLLFRLALEVSQRGQVCLEGETRTAIYRRKQ